MEANEIKGLKLLGDMFSRSLTVRGGIIDGTTQVENVLTDIIAWCFIPTFEKLDEEVDNQLTEKGIALKSLILRKLEFEDKINALEDTVRITNEEIWNANKKLVKEIGKELHKIQKFRNLLAHSPLDTSKEYRNNLTTNINSPSDLRNCPLQIIVYKKGEARKQNLDENKVIDEIERIRVTWYKLLQLFALLKNDSKDAKACETLASIDSKARSKILKHYGLNK